MREPASSQPNRRDLNAESFVCNLLGNTLGWPLVNGSGKYGIAAKHSQIGNCRWLEKHRPKICCKPATASDFEAVYQNSGSFKLIPRLRLLISTQSNETDKPLVFLRKGAPFLVHPLRVIVAQKFDLASL